MLDTMTQIEILKKNIQEAEAIIVGGASGMSAAAGFRFYYMNDATFKQIAGQLGEKYHADGFFPLAYHPQIKKGELWAALLREYKYLYECHRVSHTRICLNYSKARTIILPPPIRMRSFSAPSLPRRSLAFRAISATGSASILVQTRFIPTRERCMSCWTR